MTPVRQLVEQLQARDPRGRVRRVLGVAPELFTALLAAILFAAGLQWGYMRDRAEFQHAAAAIDNASQARLYATRAYLIVRSIEAGDRSFSATDAEAALDRAKLSLEDWLHGHSSMEWAADLPAGDEEVRRLGVDFLRDLELLREALRAPRTPGRGLRLRHVYSRVEAHGDSIGNRAAVLLREREARDRVQHEVTLFVLAFAIVLAGGWLRRVALTARGLAERERLLQRLTALLAVARTPEEVARAAAAEGIRASGAEHGSLGLVTDDHEQVRILARAGPAPPGWEASFPLAAPVPASVAIASRAPVYMETRHEMHERFPELAQPGRDHVCAIAVVPLLRVTGGEADAPPQALGYISFSFTHDRAFPPEERRFLETVGEITAQAMERATSYVAEREARAEALRERERLELILDLLPIGVGVTDATGRMLMSNRAGEEMIGQAMPAGAVAEELRRFSFLYEDGTPIPQPQLPLLRALRGERVTGEVMILRSATGVDIPLAVTAAPGPIGDDGRPAFAVSTLFDITPIREAERDLLESEARLRQMAERLPVGIFVTDAEGRVTWGNPRLAEILGAPLEAIRREGFMSFIAKEDLARMEEARRRFRGAGAGTDSERFEFRIRHASSGRLRQVVMESSAQRGRDGVAEGTVGVVEDVTEQRLLEAQLAQSQKMEAVGRLAGGVAHDFNNLLTAMLASTDLLLEDTPPGDPRRTEVREIREAALRASELTGQLLAFSRRQVIQPRAIDVNALAQGAEKLLARIIGEDVTLELALAPGLPPAHGDPGQVQQALLNLAVNARDAMPQGGVLVIATRLVPGAEVLGAQAGEPLADAYVALVVTDTGVGMADDVRERVFEPFFTTKEVGKGTGLGLSMVYGAITQMGGRVAVESVPGRGSAFHLYLQLATEAQEAEPEPQWRRRTPPGARGARASGTVLVVEDDPALRRAMQRMLERAGYEVLAAEGAEAALAIARAHEGRVDLVLTDVVMKGAGGREAAEAIAQVRPEAAIAFMSGYTADVVLRQRVSEGEAFIQKPFTPDELVEFVRGVIGGRSGE